jgi:DNA-binding NarL/FixJ family response regulator
MTEATRVLIVDDDVPTRVGLRTILEAEPDIVVIGESASADDAFEQTLARKPDVVLMDVQLGGVDGIVATQRIVRDGGDDTRVIVLTTFELDEYAFRSIQAGASGFLLKRSRAEEIVDAVRSVARGSALPLSRMTRNLIGHYAGVGRTSGTDRLTEREKEVLVLVARGLSNEEIGRTLGIRRDTVKSHIKHLFTKLDARDRAQAVIAAYESGLIAPRSADHASNEPG